MTPPLAGSSRSVRLSRWLAVLAIALASAAGSAAAPRALGHIDAFSAARLDQATPGVARDVDVVGRRAFVADGEAGLRVVDASDVSQPRAVGWLDTPGVAMGVHADGDRVHVADGAGGLRIVDASDPAAPREVAFVDDIGEARAVFAQQRYAYVASLHGSAWDPDAARVDYDGRMRVIDMERPLPCELPSAVHRILVDQGEAQTTSDSHTYAIRLGRGGLESARATITVTTPAGTVSSRADLSVSAPISVTFPLQPDALNEPIVTAAFTDKPPSLLWCNYIVSTRHDRYGERLAVRQLGDGTEQPTATSTSGPTPTASITPTPTPTGTPTPTAPCETHTVAFELSAVPESPGVGQELAVTARLSNEGCGLVGLPNYRLSWESDTEGLFEAVTPLDVTHQLGIGAGEHDDAVFLLRTLRPGEAWLRARVSFEVHLGYPGPAYWSGAYTSPLVIEVAAAPVGPPLFLPIASTIRHAPPASLASGAPSSATCPGP